MNFLSQEQDAGKSECGPVFEIKWNRLFREVATSLQQGCRFDPIPEMPNGSFMAAAYPEVTDGA